MDNIILHHGSAKIIEKPVLGLGNPKNDYGLGFYCTKNIELAKEWVVTERNDGFVNSYEFDLKGMTILYLNRKPYHILNWLYIAEKQNFCFVTRTPFRS